MIPGRAINKAVKSMALVFLGLGVPSVKVNWQDEHNIVGGTGPVASSPPHCGQNFNVNATIDISSWDRSLARNERLWKLILWEKAVIYGYAEVFTS
jgi:hypothetical protein